jgi:hypothetical protein
MSYRVKDINSSKYVSPYGIKVPNQLSSLSLVYKVKLVLPPFHKRLQF